MSSQNLYTSIWITPVIIERIDNFCALKKFVECFPNALKEMVGNGQSIYGDFSTKGINFMSAFLLFSPIDISEKMKAYQWFKEINNFEIIDTQDIVSISAGTINYANSTRSLNLLLYDYNNYFNYHNLKFIEILMASMPKEKIPKTEKILHEAKNLIIDWAKRNNVNYVENKKWTTIKQFEEIIELLLLKLKYKNTLKNIELL